MSNPQALRYCWEVDIAREEERPENGTRNNKLQHGNGTRLLTPTEAQILTTLEEPLVDGYSSEATRYLKANNSAEAR